jgi:hypothetical protein
MEPLTALEQLQVELRRRVPDANIRFDAPTAADGTWWVDVEWQGNIATVEWRPHVGFGVAGAGTGYGEGPDVVVSDAESAADQVTRFLERAVVSDAQKHAPVS